MKAKRTVLAAFAGLLAAVLCACGQPDELVDMEKVDTGQYAAIQWEGRSYVPFCVVSKNDCGPQIGYVNGDKDDRVCQYKDCPVEEWLANYLTVDGGAMLFRESTSDGAPEGLEPEYPWVQNAKSQ